MKQFLSIKEVAEVVGVSTQAVYKQLPTKLQTYAKKVGNKTVLKSTVISEVYGKNLPTEFATNTINIDNKNQPSLQPLSTDNNPIIEILQEQLRVKDQQIQDQAIKMEEQLRVKDQQIQDQATKMDKLQEEVTKQNEHNRQQSDKLIQLLEQVNDLQRNNQILLAQGQSKFDDIIESESGADVEPTQTVHKDKPNLWSRIFKNNFSG